MPSKWNVVTGATGLLGSHIAERLIARGERVRALVRPTSDVSFLKDLGVELAEGDLQQPETVRRAVDGADVVYHCAARVGDWSPRSAFQRDVIDATRTVLDACRDAGVGRVLYVSSVAVYGHPQVRSDDFTEDEPLGQHLWLREFYAQAKIQAEELVRQYPRPWTIIRPTVNYGERDRNLIPRIIGAVQGGRIGLVGTGQQKLNMLYVGDVAEAAILAATSLNGVGQAYNVTSEGDMSQRELCDVMTKFLGMPPIRATTPWTLAVAYACWCELVGWAMRMEKAPWVTRYGLLLVERSCRYSTAKARTQLGWQPQTPAHKGVRRTLDWYSAVVLNRQPKDRAAVA